MSKKQGLELIPECFVSAPENSSCPNCGGNVFIVPVFVKRQKWYLRWLGKTVGGFYIKCWDCGKESGKYQSFNPAIKDFFGES